MPNVYLIGMMGSGKSLTGKNLAVLLKYDFLDLDERVEKKNGCAISEIFTQKGEPFFRDQESLVLREVPQKGSSVIATGGGIILRPENVRHMRSTGRVVYLETSLGMLWQRLEGKKDRPLLKVQDGPKALEDIFLKRKKIYEKACHDSVATDGKNPEEVAHEVAVLLELKL